MQAFATSARTAEDTTVLNDTQLTIVVPVYDEAPNMGPLVCGNSDNLDYGILQAIETLGLRNVQVIFVDDSDNEQGRYAVNDIEGNLAMNERLTVRHIHRPKAERHDGLSGAVVHGIREATSSFVIVMDGDLQHRPQHILDMYQKLMTDRSISLVVGSRYTEGGSSSGLAGIARHFVSRACTMLTRLTLRDRMHGVTDPMTGFFAFRRNHIDLDVLQPTGFKILLELLGTHKLHVREVPIHFAPRVEGASKGDMKNGVKFLRQLYRLFRTTPVTPAA